MLQLWYCIFERKKNPHQHKDGWRRGFTFSIKYFSVIIVNIFLHKWIYFSISCTFFSLLITVIKIILLSCCKVKLVIYQDLYACFDVTDHYFELLALNKPDSVHIEHLFHPHSIIWGKRPIWGIRWYSLSAKKKGGKSICMYEHFKSIFLQRYMRDNLD